MRKLNPRHTLPAKKNGTKAHVIISICYFIHPKFNFGSSCKLDIFMGDWMQRSRCINGKPPPSCNISQPCQANLHIHICACDWDILSGVNWFLLHFLPVSVWLYYFVTRFKDQGKQGCYGYLLCCLTSFKELLNFLLLSSSTNSDT